MQVNQDLIAKDETVWQALATSHVQRGRLLQQNIMSLKPGPTAFATIKTVDFNALASFCVLFDEVMVRNIRKCTVADSHDFSEKINWDLILNELDKFFGLVIVRGILGLRNF